MFKKTWLMMTLAAIVLVLAACGSNNNAQETSSAVEEPATAASEIVIKASNWEFDQAEYKIKKGEATKISVETKSGIHGIEIQDLGVKIQAGDDKVVTINEPGTYTFFCNIQCGGGHSKMKSTIVVE
ncbi:cupredoxin domain-containing protein [Paenibacillus xanthanilyticus]|uniref:Cupredoxin domain-containing protein n=1 Tax=Paenibacillus xanthanilyticus TaxID=1783531 RepID=A0ABV8JYT7_9BACL